MFRCKITGLSAIAAVVIFASAGFAASQPELVPGRMALELNLSIIGENDRFLISGLRQCLISHLEYYLWSKGWESEIIESDSGRADNCAEFNYVARIDGEIHCRRSEAPLLDDSLQWPFADIEIKSRLQLTVRNLPDGNPVYVGKPVTVSNRENWLHFDNLDLDRQPRELPNFVFMRQVAELLAGLPSRYVRPEITDKALELEVYAREFDSDMEMALDYASWVFRRNFGISLKILNKTVIDVPSGPLEKLEEIFQESRSVIPSKEGPLKVIFYHPSDPEEAFISRNRIQVGLADVGRRLAVVTALEMPTGDYNSYRALQIGQLLIHEISHLYGAVDVADDNSIMCGYSNWISSARFDPLNHLIVSAAAGHGGRPGPVSDYLAFIAEYLERGNYTLVDFPQIFFNFQNVNNPHIVLGACKAGQFGRALPYAIKGFQDYVLKSFESSQDNFYKCLALLDDNGAVHYYLSLVTLGALADFHARKAAEAGFYPARVGVAAVSRQAAR